jgi:multidrug efflux pump subunit AcrA (membrane-fusion protein)
MKSLRYLLAVGLTLLLVSCGKQAATQNREPSGAEIFQDGKGLLISKELRQSLNVEMAAVEEQTIDGALIATAQIYRGADEPDSKSGGYRSGFAYASASVPAEAAQVLKTGQEIAVRPIQSSAPPLTARIHRLDDALRQSMGTVEILLAIPDAQHQLTIGTFLAAEFHRSGKEPVIVVPQSALLRPVGGPCVYVRNGQHLLRTAVKAGTTNADWVEICDGLLPGDEVVVRGANALWLIELRATQGGGGCGSQ